MIQIISHHTSLSLTVSVLFISHFSHSCSLLLPYNTTLVWLSARRSKLRFLYLHQGDLYVIEFWLEACSPIHDNGVCAKNAPTLIKYCRSTQQHISNTDRWWKVIPHFVKRYLDVILWHIRLQLTNTVLGSSYIPLLVMLLPWVDDHLCVSLGKLEVLCLA